MRKPIIIGNWKMNMGLKDGLIFLKELEQVTTNKEVGIACQAPLLERMKANAHNVLIGAQNVHEETKGAYTGEISVELLKELNVDFAIIGHSERRTYYNENDEKINLKAKQLQANNIMPVICVGETLEQFESGKTLEVINKQVEVACKDLDIEKCVIAYEPVWAIGTGKTATTEIAQNICSAIREKLSKLYNSEQANKVRIQYGGSVNESNIKDLLDSPDIDGALVGGASLKIADFIKLIEA